MSDKVIFLRNMRQRWLVDPVRYKVWDDMITLLKIDDLITCEELNEVYKD